MKNNVTHITPEQSEQAIKMLEAVNLDEVVIEIIQVKVREYKMVDVLDDENDPVLSDDDKPLKYRKATTRTAHIQNFVPLPVYNRMLSLQKDLNSNNLELQIPIMTELVLEVWKVSEPFMTSKRLQDGLEVDVIGALFRRFFTTSRLQKGKV